MEIGDCGSAIRTRWSWKMNRRERMRWFFGLVLLCPLSVLCSSQQSKEWPRVQAITKVFEFSDSRNAELTLDLFGTDKRVLYRLECHNWTYDKDPDFDYSGDFECRLSPRYETTAYSTLFTEEVNQTRDWESRARFLVPELKGRCGEWPEFGRIRTFRLRGMQIRLELTEMKFSKTVPSFTRRSEGLASFKLVVSMAPEPGARSAITEKPNVPTPPAECGRGYGR